MIKKPSTTSIHSVSRPESASSETAPLLPPPETSILAIPHILPIELSLLTNVLLSSFDMTVTASTYTTIGSEFDAVDISSWITTSYMITSTSCQPLYGAISDVLGRRACYFFATSVFSLGCVGCALSTNIVHLFLARALTGIGGGGLITLATVVNSDIIPASKRGLFQGFQNILIGVGGILGASLGGLFAETIGWRCCFLVQVPFSLVGLTFGYLYIKDQDELKADSGIGEVDVPGSVLLVSGLTLQLLALYSTGKWTYLCGFVSVLVLYAFVRVELSTHRTPIVPFRKMRGPGNYLTLLISTLAGFSNMAYIFVLPLLFQIALGDSPAQAGFRLAIPSAFTSVGSLTTAYVMNLKLSHLPKLMLSGVSLMFVGNWLALSIDSTFPKKWINVLLIPANTGLGMCYPATLFTYMFAFPKQLQASSTSTLYLFRSIGQVWGVAVVSSAVQLCLKRELVADGVVDNDLVEKILKSITYIKHLSPELREVVLAHYEEAIQFAQRFSVSVCLVNVILCAIKVYSDS